MIRDEINRVLRLEGNAILESAKRFESSDSGKELEKALRLFEKTLNDHGKIVVTGVGKSGKIAQKIAATLSSTGSLSIFVHPTEGLHGDLGVIRPEDSVLALSHSGNTGELISLIPSLLKLGVSIVGMGGNEKSQLRQHSHAWIDSWVEQEACPHNLAPTTSTTLALAIGDALAIALMKLRQFDVEQFAKNHPGGAIGRKIHSTVADLLHSDVATVSKHAPMEEVVVAATENKLGGVLVVQSKSLLGLITDGDIRRALRHREKFFELTAQEVMTSNPVSVSPEASAAHALELMENRSSQISVLPVVTPEKQWLGLIRLHDLVKII